MLVERTFSPVRADGGAARRARPAGRSPVDDQRQLSGAWRSERLREHARGDPTTAAGWRRGQVGKRAARALRRAEARSPRPSPSPKQPALSSRRFLAERRGLAQCDATIAAACRVQSEGSKWRTARCPPTGGGLCPPMGGQGRTASARTTSANIPPRPSTHPNLGALRGGGVTSGLFRWGDRRTSSARGMIGRTTSASLVSLRGRRAQHEYEPVHTPLGR